ncbi:MAG TPA: hypothetical protein DCS91_01320 [Microcoleaceae bacterium UBA11344]|nr:hypothetical protein [Microcoleaceae cyanobacterium UBA11344]
MAHCPCCSNPRLCHFGQNQVYWFCRQCWQSVPVKNLNSYGSLPSTNLVTELGIKKHNSSLAII